MYFHLDLLDCTTRSAQVPSPSQGVAAPGVGEADASKVELGETLPVTKFELEDTRWSQSHSIYSGDISKMHPL